MGFQIPITIAQAIERISSNAYLLPSIQREFEWPSSKIEWLFDSILRGYPFGSFLFWQVKGETKKAYKFYKFLKDYRQNHQTHNEEFPAAQGNDFIAILDGQQRLTSLYIGLCGSHAIKRPYLHDENTERVYPTRHLYLNIEHELEGEEDGRLYEFKFLTDNDGSDETKWFRVSRILELSDINNFMDFLALQTPFARRLLSKLHNVVFQEGIINYYLEESQEIDKALNIFIRINSGGLPLNFSDLLMSIAVANWRRKDARKEIHALVDAIRDKGFSTNKDFVLKAFLYLYSKNIKFKVTNFSKENAELFEDKWEGIRDVILTVFDLVRSFGFVDSTLRAKNALLPIIYYLYHRGLARDVVNSVALESDRKAMRKWLHIVLLTQLFGRAADSVLVQMRQKFTVSFDDRFLDDGVVSFPIDDLLRGHPVAEETVLELLTLQKDDGYSFSVLALLYPNLEYRYNDFHKDHLHSSSAFDETLGVEWRRYNSIVNLQLLDSRENESKQDKSLDKWVAERCADQNRRDFLDRHLIPDIDLSREHVKDFLDTRETLLKEKLYALLNVGLK